ncbi:TIGR03032 family protein [Pigmentiphaga aceris]|uniref:TIGR03032 family protein n=1 Tax=Pigmentiphaga aceris TaxID=1940612 RepID=UPI0016521CE5|nr:TIGR03032 family protein [Pigmentiphaga aceris]
MDLHIDAGFLALLASHNLAVAATVGPDGLIVIGRDRVGRPAIEHRVIHNAFALAVSGSRLAVSHKYGITVYNDCRALAAEHPTAPGRYDAYYAPLVTFHTGDCLVHDMVATRKGLVVANTRFSTVDLIDGRYNANPIWRPPFISVPMPEDRCHLNGLALDGETLKYVTAFGPFDTAGGWRSHPQFHGVLIDAVTGRCIAEKLSVPHSPRIIDGHLYVCESGHGTLLRVDPSTGQRTVVCELPGLPRGLAAHAGIAFIGLSSQRHSSSLPTLPILARHATPIAGIAAVDLATGNLLGMARIQNPGREILDVKLIPNCMLPGVGERNDHHEFHLTESPAGAYWLKSASRPKTVPVAAPAAQANSNDSSTEQA